MQWVSAILLLIGASFALLAAVGIVRMPDFYTRLHVITKASTLGISCLVLAAAIEFEGTEATTRALLVIAFLTLTAPISAQMIAMAAYADRVPLWEDVIVDELQDRERQLEPPPEQPLPPEPGADASARGD